MNLHIYPEKAANWQQELANVVTDPNELLSLLNLNPHEFTKDIQARRLFPMRVPRFFVDQMEKANPNDPLFLQVMPKANEFRKHPEFIQDPLQEHDVKIPGLLHKYKNRVLLMVKTGCAVNCRYCFRREFPYQSHRLSLSNLSEVLAYLENDTNIHEVILSGGDPLMAKDEHLASLIQKLENIKHLKHLRIHTRLPIVLPKRLTEQLANVLKETRLKCAIVLHSNHANEISMELKNKLIPFYQAGVTLLNQAVLLKNINDTVAAQTTLSEALYDANILPYYLHLLDKVEGASHFDVSEQEAIQLIEQLRVELAGFLVPKLVREIGGESSKTRIA